MPSQEEYLDQLLKGIVDEPVSEEKADDIADAAEDSVLDAVEDFVDSPDPDDDILKKMVLENATIEAVLGNVDEENLSEIVPEESPIGTMSEDEIEQILAANNSGAVSSKDDMGNFSTDEDLMSLLEESSDGELQDIYDMLHKSDNNEAVDDELLALLQGASDGDEVSRLQAELEQVENAEEQDDSATTKRQQKALEKRRLKEEKAEAKRVAREAKKAEKEAQRAAKQAEKESKKKAKKESQSAEGESAMVPMEAVDDKPFEKTSELSSTDMQDLQELLAVGGMQSPSDDAILQFQQDANSQPDPLMVDVPDAATPYKAEGGDEKISADMQEIDELLNLAGISDMMQAETENNIPADTSSDIQLVDEAQIGDLIPEKEKKGIFARILDFLTETDDDFEEEKGTEDIPLSDENKNILEEMDREENTSGKKGKKNKKSKKGKKAQANPEAMGEDGEEVVAPKEKKGKKAKKPKKEKPAKAAPSENPKSKLPVKNMISIGVICISILAVILLLVNLGGDFAVKREAKKAYYQEDYETCYQVLYGKKLNESEQVMFAKSESILRINLRMREYKMFVEERSEVEALDVLIQTVHDYAKLYEYASKWNAAEEVAAVYSQMLGILQDKYNLTESGALEIAAEPDDVEYTKMVTAVAEGKGYRPSNEETVISESLPDMLPEELQFPENKGGR